MGLRWQMGSRRQCLFVSARSLRLEATARLVPEGCHLDLVDWLITIWMPGGVGRHHDNGHQTLPMFLNIATVSHTLLLVWSLISEGMLRPACQAVCWLSSAIARSPRLYRAIPLDEFRKLPLEWIILLIWQFAVHLYSGGVGQVLIVVTLLLQPCRHLWVHL